MFCYGCWECYPFIEGDRAIVRWHADDRAIDTIEYHVIYMYIVLSRYRCRTIASSRYCSIVLSSIVAPLLSNYRTITSSLSHYCVIALSIQTSMVDWCDSELHGPNRTLCFFHLAGNISRLIVWLNVKFFLQINSFPHLYFRKYINF